MVDPDPDEDLYDIDISKEQSEFFERVAQRHSELFDDSGLNDWVYMSHPTLRGMVLRPEGVEEVIQVVLDMWQADGLDVEDTKYAEFMDALESDALPEDQLPYTFRD